MLRTNTRSGPWKIVSTFALSTTDSFQQRKLFSMAAVFLTHGLCQIETPRLTRKKRSVAPFTCRLVEEMANNLSDGEKEQLNRKPLYQKSEEWQNILQQKKKINHFDQPIKMELDKIPSQEVGE